MSLLKQQAYDDTVEIVKAVLGSQGSINVISDKHAPQLTEFIDVVYGKLCEIKKDAGSND